MASPRLRASVVCRVEGHLLVVRLRDPATGQENLFPPGGGVEENETPAETASREALEETGLRVRITGPAQIETYPYRWDGKDYDVTTHYFLAEPEEPGRPELPPVVDATYNLGASWAPVSEALDAMPRSIALAVAALLRRA